MDTARADAAIDRQKVEEVLKQVNLPPEFKHIDVHYGPDYDGDPSVSLTFRIADGIEITDDDVPRLSRFMAGVVSSLYNAQVGGYVYDHLDPAA